MVFIGRRASNISDSQALSSTSCALSRHLHLVAKLLISLTFFWTDDETSPWIPVNAGLRAARVSHCQPSHTLRAIDSIGLEATGHNISTNSGRWAAMSSVVRYERRARLATEWPKIQEDQRTLFSICEQRVEDSSRGEALHLSHG